MPKRVNGGIYSDTFSTDKVYIRFTKAAGDFGMSVSNGTVKLDEKVVGGDANVTHYFTVQLDAPVPNSAAHFVVQTLGTRAKIEQIQLVQTSFRTTEIQVVCDATTFGWIDALGAVDLAPLVAAIQSLGTLTVWNTSGNVDPTIGTPTTEAIDMSNVTAAVISVINFA